MTRLPRALSQWLLRRFKQRVRGAHDGSLSHCLAAAEATVRKTPYAFLITQSRTGAPSARLVEPLFDADDWVFWIGTNPSLRKIAQIELNPSVTLAYGNHAEHANVVLTGNVALVKDLAQRRAHFKPAWKLFFPDGPAGDDFVLIKFVPRRMELMNFRRGVVPEPFGLRPISLVRKDFGWALAEG